MPRRITGLAHEAILARTDAMERRVTDLVRACLERALGHFGAVALRAAGDDQPADVPPEQPPEAPPSADDLNVILTIWPAMVEATLIPAITGIVAESAAAIADSIASVWPDHPVPRLVPSAAAPAMPVYTTPSLATDPADVLIQSARNRLVGIGDVVWHAARTELSAGIAAGESIPELRDRVMNAAGVSVGRATLIARTETMAVVNAASITQTRHAGLTGLKEWLATPDFRTRLTHARANGQRVPMAGKFDVGGYQLDYPGDPSGPGEEVCNCRCTTVYILDPPGGAMPTEPAELTAAAAAVHTGAMVALVPTARDIARLTLPDGEPADQLHLTMHYLGDAADIDPAGQQAIAAAVRAAVEGRPAISGQVFGAAVWNPDSDEPCTVLNVGGAQVEQAHDAILDALGKLWGLSLPDNHAPWQPHIALAYSSDPQVHAAALTRGGPVTFDRVRVAFAGVNTDIPLTPAAGMVAAAEEIPMPTEDTVTAAGASTWDAGANEKRLPSPVPAVDAREAYAWVDESQVKAGAVPKSGCKLLHHDIGANGSVGDANMTGCSSAVGALHGARSETTIPQADRRAAYDHLAKHMRDAGKTPPPFEVWAQQFADDMRYIVGEDGPESTPPVMAPMEVRTEGNTWEGILVVEGVETGDGRMFAPGSLTWATPPLPLAWQRQSAEGHDGSVIAARIDRVWRDATNPTIIRGAGVFDTDGVDGTEALRQVREQFLKGVSVDVDAIKDADVEVVFPDTPAAAGETGASDDLLAELFGPPPDHIVFHTGRIRGATLVGLPAFVEAQIWLTGVTTNAPLPPAVTAAATVVEAPPAEWFANPGLPGPTPLTVTDDGRVFGHAALFGTCHIGVQDRCVQPPREDRHDYFMLGEVLTAAGQFTAVGPITLGTGHAPLHGLTPARALEHYDNTGTRVADVAVGNDAHGIWVAGAIRPGLSEERLAQLRAATLSGDWRRIGGQLRLVALLAVNVPGFPVPRLASRLAEGRQLALVASGVITDSELRNDTNSERQELVSIVRRNLARRIGADPQSRRAAARARIS